MVMDVIPRLGVNIDHVATLRQQRHTPYPSLVEAAQSCVLAGAQQITVHLREDRRHIQDQDVKALSQHLKGKALLNLEMACSEEMVRFALRIVPQWACLVPEKRQELTTEGGLDLKKGRQRIKKAITSLSKKKIKVSLFVEPSKEAIRASQDLGADAVEIHTGKFCLLTQAKSQTASTKKRIQKELDRIREAGLLAKELGMLPHAGHGIDYQNIRPLVEILDEENQSLLREYNIGHAIVCRAAMVGMERAVREMVSLITAP